MPSQQWNRLHVADESAKPDPVDLSLKTNRYCFSGDPAAVVSSHAVNKYGYVQKEIRLALDAADKKPERTIFIIPLKLDECPVPESLGRWHWLNYSSPGGYDSLLRALRIKAATVDGPSAESGSSVGYLTSSQRRAKTKVTDPSSGAGP